MNNKQMLAIPIVIDGIECIAGVDGNEIQTIIEESERRTRIYLKGKKLKEYFVTTMDFDKLLEIVSNLDNGLIFVEVEEGEAHGVKSPEPTEDKEKESPIPSFWTRSKYDIKFKDDHN